MFLNICGRFLILKNKNMINQNNQTKKTINEKVFAFIDCANLYLSLKSINWKINNLLVPNRKKYSGLLKNKKFKKITNYLNESIHKFAYKIEKAP